MPGSAAPTPGRLRLLPRPRTLAKYARSRLVRPPHHARKLSIRERVADNPTLGYENTLGCLPQAADAPFNSFAKQYERVDLLDEIYSWADGPDERGIFWLSGLAGTGKSTVARAVARRYYDRQRLAASFFFSRGGGDTGHAGKFATSIAVQLVHEVPASRQHISDALPERSDIVGPSLGDQWQHLVLCPLSVIALDKCDNEYDIRIIVQLLAEARSSLIGARLRVFLTSRPECRSGTGLGRYRRQSTGTQCCTTSRRRLSTTT